MVTTKMKSIIVACSISGLATVAPFVDQAAAQCTPWASLEFQGPQIFSFAPEPNGGLLAGAAGGVNRWNGSSWSFLGGAQSSIVLSIVPTSAGGVIAGGNFMTFNGITANGIVRRNGSEWLALGSGTDGDVQAVLELPNGDIIAGGLFSRAGGVAAESLARWNGTEWSSLGLAQDSWVFALAALPNGHFLAGGNLRFVGSPVVYGVGRWDGTSVQPLGSFGAGCRHLAIMPSGQIVAAGSNSVAIWNGLTWANIGAPIGTEWIRSLTVLPNGDLVVVVALGTGGPPQIARWNGTWSFMPTPNDVWVTNVSTLSNGDLIAGGGVGTLGGIGYVGRYNPSVCYANCDCSTVSPLLNVLDFSCFLSRFRAAGSLPTAQQMNNYVNCDGSTTAPVLNALDFSCFLQRYVAGCP